MNICHIRYVSGTLLVSLVVLLSACAANPPSSPQIINTPASADNGSATLAVSKISTDNITAPGAAPLEPNIQDRQVAEEPSVPVTISAADCDNMSNYYGKEVIVEGTIVELGVLVDPNVGKALVLYFNNRDQHVTTYDAWARGMTGTDFRVIIRETDIPKFCYRSMFMDRRMAVAGTIVIYNSAPVIFVSDPSQVTLVGTPAVLEPSLSIVITCTTEIADNITYYRYQGTITNNNTEWAVHDLYLGENKLSDCIAPKGCPNTAELRFGKQVLLKSEGCPNNIKFDVKVSGDAATGTVTDPLTKQISIPAVHYTWKGVPAP